MNAPSRASAGPPFAIVAVLFLLSGASGLVYEVVWTRTLTTFFGSTLYGVATVLSAFMGGLALGSWLIGKRADAMRKPLMAYGLFEIGIGAAALLFPHLLRATQPLIGSFYATGGESTFYVFSLIRFVVVFLLLLIPTTLMGATLPILSRAVTANFARAGRSVGGLYALNTAGAVVGVFATGFYMLEHFGIAHTTLVAVAMNALIGIAAILIGKATPDLVDPADDVLDEVHDGVELSPAALRVVLISYGVSGFVALAYQVCWTRALIFSFESLKSTTYSFSGMLIVFLLGLAIGSAVMQAVVDRQRNLLRFYGMLQVGIGLFGGASYYMIQRSFNAWPELYPDGTLRYGIAVLNVMMKTAETIGIPTLMMGMAFPVVVRLTMGSLRRLGKDVARVYAINTAGAIVGSFLCGFALIPLLGIVGTMALLCAMNLALAAVIFFVNEEIPGGARNVLIGGCAIVAVVLPLRMVLSDSRLQRIQRNEHFIHYEEGAMATISVVANESDDRTIYVDDVGVAGTDKVLLTDQKSLAHVPMVLLGGKAEHTLSVGFGSGGASYSYTLYANDKDINTIEIAPEVLRAAPVLTDSNHGIIVPDWLLAKANAAGSQYITGFRHPNSDYIYTPAAGFKTFDPRFRVIIDDARSYLRFTKKQFDVIATDCTDLRYKTNANLYDLEYFTLCRSAISDRGLVVVWMPLAGLSDRAFSSALRTFQVVFPEMSVWYFTNQPTHYCLLIGGKKKLSIDYQAVRDAAALPGIAEDLDEIGLRDPDKLISSFVCDERSLKESLKDYPLNTEDHPIIEFESPRYGYDSRPLHDNQAKLYAMQNRAGDLLVNVPPGTNAAERIWTLQQANAVVFEGHSAYRLFDFRKACELYQKALAMAPDDKSIARLLDFEELRTHYESVKNQASLHSMWTAHGLATVYEMQGRYSDAVTVAEPMLEKIARAKFPEDVKREDIDQARTSLRDIVAECYEKAGQPAKGAEIRRKY